ncbi:hypothetical protein P3W85_16090, partial [Cupriavidus basilensis]
FADSWWARQSCLTAGATGANGITTADGIGFIVVPLIAMIRGSSRICVTGANGYCLPILAGFVVGAVAPA